MAKWCWNAMNIEFSIYPLLITWTQAYSKSHLVSNIVGVTISLFSMRVYFNSKRNYFIWQRPDKGFFFFFIFVFMCHLSIQHHALSIPRWILHKFNNVRIAISFGVSTNYCGLRSSTDTKTTKLVKNYSQLVIYTHKYISFHFTRMYVGYVMYRFLYSSWVGKFDCCLLMDHISNKQWMKCVLNEKQILKIKSRDNR